jgi:hypothetical protein
MFFWQKYDKSILKVLQSAADAVEYTPDMWRECRFEWRRLFIPDEMQRGFYRYPLIQENSWFRARAFTEESFTMWKKKLGEASYAIVLPQAYSNVPLAHIGGQLHYVRPNLFKELDKLKLNGLQFIRRPVSVMVPFREQVSSRTAGHERVRRCYAFMYVGIADYWNRELDGGYYFEPVRRYESKSAFVKDYYLFSKLEYTNATGT